MLAPTNIVNKKFPVPCIASLKASVRFPPEITGLIEARAETRIRLEIKAKQPKPLLKI